MKSKTQKREEAAARFGEAIARRERELRTALNAEFRDEFLIQELEIRLRRLRKHKQDTELKVGFASTTGKREGMVLC